MAGNVGTQSLAVTVRSLGLYEFDTKKRFAFIFRETRVAFLNGFLLALISFGTVSLYLVLTASYSSSIILLTALCVSLALLFAMTVSGFVGALIPISFDRMKIDPAVASGPLITTLNDLIAVISYYGLAALLLLKFF
jgi:magnesium transporter